MPVGDKGRREREITDRSVRTVAASRLNNDAVKEKREGEEGEKKAKEGIAW